MSAPEDALIAEAAQALAEHPDCRVVDYDPKGIQFACGVIVFESNQGTARDFTEARRDHVATAVIEAVRDQIAAEALREAADEADSIGHHWSGAPAQAFFALASDLRTRADRLDPKETP